MHIISKLFENNTNDIWSPEIDVRDHVSMSLQIKGLSGGTTATLYGTLFDFGASPISGRGTPLGKDYIPVSVAGSTTLSANGIYVIPPYFRYYKLKLNRSGASSVTASFYALRDGAFLQSSEMATDPKVETFFDRIRLGQQRSIQVDHQLDSSTTMLPGATTGVIPGNQEIYLGHLQFSVCGLAGAEVEVVKTIGANTSRIYRYVLTGNKPDIVDPIYFLDKLDHGTDDCTISIRANRILHDYEAKLYGRVILYTR